MTSSTPSGPDASEAIAQRLPKVLLHDHLDGSLRDQTLFELLLQRGLTPPADDVAGLGAWFDAKAHAGSLEKYLEGFALTVAAMGSPAAVRRVAREAAEDAHADGALLAEFRMAPLLLEAHGVSGEAAIEAMLEGLADSPLPAPTHSGLIVCSLRHLPPPETERAAKLALKYLGRGVIGFDLAGAEFGHPPSEHAAALRMLRDAGMPLTLHAGEADVAERVIEAGRLGATRIGHGVRLVDALGDPERAHLLAEARSLGLHLEVCPTSNLHTGAARSVTTHPIAALWRAGISLSYHPDNRLMSRISQSSEAQSLLELTALQPADLLAMAAHAARASFLPQAARDQALAVIEGFLP